MYAETATMPGPAVVIAIDGDRLTLERDGRTCEASLALAVPYGPEPGDVVLAIGEDPAWVIGVVRGRGRTTFAAPGDLHIRAEGRVEIEGAAGLELRGPRIVMKADRLETLARDVFERCVNAYRWVRELLQTQGGRVRTVVEDQYSVHARRIVETADKDVRIDGERIRLG